MLDGEQPEAASSRVVRLGRKGGRARRHVESAPERVAEHLGALEQAVAGALGARRGRAAAAGAMWLSVDTLLAHYASVRRWLEWQVVPSGEPLGALSLLALYRYWWRVDAVGLERIPASGPVLLVANRAGTLLPYDAFMVAVALAMDHPTGRRVRPLVDEWLTRVPLVGAVLRRLGAEPATAARLRHLLEAGEAAVVFAEGREAFAKSFAHRYRLARFGRNALLRVAVDVGAPVVPVAVIGAEETHPVLWRSEAAGRPFGLPAMPITPTLLPLPTKWTVHVGAPLETRPLAETAADVRTAVGLIRTQLRERLQGLVSEALGRRKGLFFA